jgi:predicted SAM-dependent methyltransferase
LPFADNSFRGIFTEHTLEHFKFQNLRDGILPELFRILAPGGILRIVVPDAERAIDSYIAARGQGMTAEPFRDENPRALTPMMSVANTFRRLFEPYPQGHEFAWDYQTLEYFLWRVGFREIRREQYMQGRDETLLVDYGKRASESLYVEASKPLSAP